PRRRGVRRAARGARAQPAAQEEHRAAARRPDQPRHARDACHAGEEILIVRAVIVAVLLAAVSAAPAVAAPGDVATPFARSLAFDGEPPASGPLAYAGLPLDLGDQPMISRLTLATGSITAPRDPSKDKPKKGKKQQVTNDSNEGLGPERARIL